MKEYRRALKEESNNPFDIFYSHFKNKIKNWSTMAGTKDIYNWLIDDLKELSNISHTHNYNYDFSSGYDTIAKELIKRAKKDFEWLHEDFKMSKNKLKESVLWDDLTDVEKIAYNYANDYISQGYSIEDAVTQGCFVFMNHADDYEDDIDDYEDPDPRKIKRFLMHKYKAPFGRKPKDTKKPLYIIKDSHGNQLSAPSEDDYELWDRVAAMEARGKRGLSVVAYTEGLSEVLDDRCVERYGVDGEWWYFTTHGVQPGSVPKGIEILDIIDTPNGSFFCSDRVLNTSELRYYDIKEKAPRNTYESLRNYKMKVRNLDEATINKQFRKDIKREYKNNQSINSINKEKRNSLMKMISDEDSPKAKDLANRLFPEKPFKYDFPKHLEKNDFPFYVTYYQEYPIYEPAEGGYYYAGMEAIYSKGFDTREEAEEHLREVAANEYDSGWGNIKNGVARRGKYIGEGEQIVIETRRDYLSQEKGWEPYQ